MTARALGRTVAGRLGFPAIDQTVIATAISEVARNIVQYAREGEIDVGVVRQGTRQGVMIVARDVGPGIPDLPRAMQDGYSTGKGLGMGLPGMKRMMDEFAVESVVGQGTTVTMKKWRR